MFGAIKRLCNGAQHWAVLCIPTIQGLRSKLLCPREELTRSGARLRSPSGQSGGADRDRTGDLLLAKQALSQLSYSPLTTSN
jgi:hypothetical protein